MKFLPFKRLFLINSFITILLSVNGTAFADNKPIRQEPIAKQLATLEASLDDGKIGVYAINTANNQIIQHRADEYFPIQSTFKVMAVSAILKRSMEEKDLLQQKISYTKNDLVFWSPIAEKHLTEGMTIAELCAASIMYSDNTATNLIVKKLGGPAAVTAFARSIGDDRFQITNWEPELNSNPNNKSDASTPKAMLTSLKKLTFGNVLAPSQREQLVTWMKSNTTGDTRIRAGVPKGWIVADKTGSGNEFGIANDIGVIWPTHCDPIIIAIYTVHNKNDAHAQDDLIARVTRNVINEFQTKTCRLS